MLAAETLIHHLFLPPVAISLSLHKPRCMSVSPVFVNLIPVPLGRKKDPFCLYIRKPITQKVKRNPDTDLVNPQMHVAPHP